MHTDYQRYLGFRPVKVDPKFRVSIPPAWRPEEGESLYLLLSRDYEMPLVKVLTKAAYDRRVSQVLASPNLSDMERSKTLGTLAMLCRVVTLNEQGKLLVPKDLSERAEIEPDSDAVLSGRGMHFELWSQANFDRMFAIENQTVGPAGLDIF